MVLSTRSTRQLALKFVTNTESRRVYQNDNHLSVVEGVILELTDLWMEFNRKQRPRRTAFVPYAENLSTLLSGSQVRYNTESVYCHRPRHVAFSGHSRTIWVWNILESNRSHANAKFSDWPYHWRLQEGAKQVLLALSYGRLDGGTTFSQPGIHFEVTVKLGRWPTSPAE
jgi:hypothetical protein